MALFNRNQNQQRTMSVLPSEVDEYYRAEQRKRRGSAFLLGLMTLVLTVLFVLGIFFLGRYFYHKIKGDDNTNAVSTVQQKANESKEAAKQSTDDLKASTANTSEATNTQSSNSSSSSSAATTVTPQQSAATAAPATGDNFPGTTLPRTGDEGM